MMLKILCYRWENNLHKMNEEEERLDQPEVFELELEILRWVKKAVMETIPPIMQKPSGNAAQYYGLDSKSR